MRLGRAVKLMVHHTLRITEIISLKEEDNERVAG
jgi:hypothetical protein